MGAQLHEDAVVMMEAAAGAGMVVREGEGEGAV